MGIAQAHPDTKTTERIVGQGRIVRLCKTYFTSVTNRSAWKTMSDVAILLVGAVIVQKTKTVLKSGVYFTTGLTANSLNKYVL